MSQIASLLVVLDKLALVATFNKAKISPFWEIATLRQINGSFINADLSLNTVNLAKLFSKIEPTTYHLVLPDQLFQLNMQSVPHTSDQEVADYLDAAPADSISQHEILLKLKDKSQVQIATIKKELLDQIFHLQTNADLVISQVMPLSWLAKPIIGLEPALSLIHIEDTIYLAQHYLGLEKAAALDPANVDALLDHLKKLKNQEPNLQIIYLMTETRLENVLKRELKSVLPMQQLAPPLGEDNIAPPIKAYLENAWRAIMSDTTLMMSFAPASYADFARAKKELPETKPAAAAPEPAPEPEPEPEKPAAPASEEEEIIEIEEEEVEIVSEPEPEATPEPAASSTEPSAPADEPQPEPEPTQEPAQPSSAAAPAAAAALIKSLPADDEDDDDFNATLADVVAKQKVMIDNQDDSAPLEKRDTALSSDKIEHKKSTSDDTPIIMEPKKKKSLRPLWIGLIIVVVTVAIGCLVGKILLDVLDSSVKTDTATPAPTPVATPTPAPTPVASVSAQIEESAAFDSAEYSILVVNATGVSGLAGATKTKLDAAGYKEVVTGNAAGDYDAAGDYEDMEGDLVLLKTPNLDLVSHLTQDSGLELSHDTNKENYQAEDAVSKYDAVIVLRVAP